MIFFQTVVHPDKMKKYILVAIPVLIIFIGLFWLGIRVGKNQGRTAVPRLPSGSETTVYPKETSSPSNSNVSPRQTGVGLAFGYDREADKILADPSLKDLFFRTNDYVDIVYGKGSPTGKIPQAHSLGIKVSCVHLNLDSARTAVADTNTSARCDYFAYNPEAPKRTQQTPDEELNNLPESAQTFSRLAKQYGVPSVIGPGFKFMSQHEDYYRQAAEYADIWLIQTQVLTLNKKTNRKASPEEYRQEVKRIIDLIHQGNPDTKIWAQIIISTGPPPEGQVIFSPEDIVEYIRSISDLVENVRIYTGSDPSQTENVIRIIKTLRQ